MAVILRRVLHPMLSFRGDSALRPNIPPRFARSPVRSAKMAASWYC